MSQLLDRQYRKLENAKESGIRTINHAISKRNILDGEIVISKPKNKPLKLSKKVDGELWNVNFSNDGNQYVEKTLSTHTLKYTNKFIDYRFIVHNFQDDIGTTKHYVPWFNNSLEDTDMNHSSRSFLAPYNMTLHKLIMRPETLSDATADFTFGLDKQDDGDTTVDSVATVTYSTTLASNTMITINQSDWNNNPKIEAGDKVGLSIDSSADSSGSIDWYITSVWRVEVVI